ncbi:hypothetical protein AB205_0204310, partial [Aquarana catesbeiana]
HCRDTDRCTRQMDVIIPTGLLGHTKMLDAAGTNNKHRWRDLLISGFKCNANGCHCQQNVSCLEVF